MTLVIVVDDDDAAGCDGGCPAAPRAPPGARHHPRQGRGASQINAQVGTGSGWTGETALIRLHGGWSSTRVRGAPAATRLPGRRSGGPTTHPTTRRPTHRPPRPPPHHRRRRRLAQQDRGHPPASAGPTPSATPTWRGPGSPVAGPRSRRPGPAAAPGDRRAVAAERWESPSADLLVAWLSSRLKVQIERRNSRAPASPGGRPRHGRVRSDRRSDGKLATFSSPDRPTGRSPSNGVTCPSCSPRSCASSTRTTCTPRPPASCSRWSARSESTPRGGPSRLPGALATAVAGELLASARRRPGRRWDAADRASPAAPSPTRSTARSLGWPPASEVDWSPSASGGVTSALLAADSPTTNALRPGSRSWTSSVPTAPTCTDAVDGQAVDVDTGAASYADRSARTVAASSRS